MKDIPSGAFDIEKINEEIAADVMKFISFSEAEIEEKVEGTAEKILEKGNELKIVLVSGRSASGKTTFVKKVCRRLCEKGREARHISLDDFFLGTDFLPKNEDGTYDMESIKGVDTALANECFALLLREGKADFPTFDFPGQSRGEKWNRVEIGKNGIVFIEGIHALNPALTENLPEKGIMRIFIEPEKSFFLGGKTVFSPREVRFIRRITRDELFRAWCAEKTFAQWKSVLSGEKIYIEPYIHLADFVVDTAMPSEPAALKEILSEMLLRIDEKSPFFSPAMELFEKLSAFEKINPDFLPEDSLLREFVG